MKKDSFDHPKMKALARSLGEPIFAANGLVARLWWFAGQYTPAGDIGKFDDEAITDSLGYDLSKATELVASLVESGFVDVSDEHRLIIHDWPDHCEDTIHAKLARKHEFFANGDRPKTRLLNNIEREKAESFYASGTQAAKKCNPVRTKVQSLSPCLSPCLSPDKKEVRDVVAPMSPDGDSSPVEVSPNSHPTPELARPPKAEHATTFPAPLDTDDFRQAWGEWRKHRTEIRKPIKPTSERKQLELMATWGHERAMAALTHTMAMGWQGIREPDAAAKASASEFQF